MTKQSKRRQGLGVYSNLATKRRTKKDAAARKRAEYLASLPKHPVKRLLYRLHPKRVAQYWFSKRGAFMALKLLGVFILLGALGIGAIFAYYRNDLESLRPEQLAARVQTTVTKYYDRNGKLLWEDKGTGDYRLVVESGDISDYMKKATIAIEDKDFYKHGGISVSGIMRSVINNASGGDVQGGSTLTQQLVKQVFFTQDEVSDRGFSGVPRKIKEMILAIEVERMYSKDEILTLYLNESSYGGRRNGVESAAQTYFGVPAKKLNLAQSALLAAIPNSPGRYDPYSGDNAALINRQHQVLDDMVRTGSIKQSEADAAKKINILDTIRPQGDQLKDIKAPHFVLMVKKQLEDELGKAVVGRGGLVVKTTLDLDIQNKLESSMSDVFNATNGVNCYGLNCSTYGGFSNGAGVVEDVQTGQVLALLGSRDFNYPGFGQDNAATAFIQPGSTIKPLVYAQLFQDQGAGNSNYGSGSILPDTKTTWPGGSQPFTPRNADGSFRGNITIRQSLAWSRNIPAIKAMDIVSKEAAWNTIHAMGDTSYCTDGADANAGLASAIGGCGAKMTEHVNAIASLARMGNYIPQSYILEVKNSSGTTLKKFTQPAPKEAVNQQSAYIVNDILSDKNARAGLFGSLSITPNMDATGSKMALKTGTSDINTLSKDLWNVVYTPHVAMAVWFGNSDNTPIERGNSSIPTKLADPVMAYATDKYIQEGKAKASDWFTQPSGIQVINGQLYPSYFNKADATTSTEMTFDKVSKKKATKCTPEGAKIKVSVSSFKNGNKRTYITTNGYDPNSEDDVHKCSDVKPTVTVSPSNDGSTIDVTYSAGTFPLSTIVVSVDGKQISSFSVSGSGTRSITYSGLKSSTASYTVKAVVTDKSYYESTNSATWSRP